jgi:hypothetical protein
LSWEGAARARRASCRSCKPQRSRRLTRRPGQAWAA